MKRDEIPFWLWLQSLPEPDALNPTRQDSTTVKTFNEKEEHENDLRQESLRDFETWETEQGE